MSPRMSEPRILLHDPELAREAYLVHARLAGRSPNPSSYRLWLNRYVDEIAALLGYVVGDEHRLRAWKAKGKR